MLTVKKEFDKRMNDPVVSHGVSTHDKSDRNATSSREFNPTALASFIAFSLESVSSAKSLD